MAETGSKEKAAEAKEGDGAAGSVKQEALLARLSVAKGDTKNANLPFGGALIKVGNLYYEPSQLRIASFAINPYEGQLVAGQMFQCSIMLPGEKEPFEISVAGAVKTLDQAFGLRAVFSSPQPVAQQALAQHLIATRKPEEPAKSAAKKKSLW